MAVTEQELGELQTLAALEAEADRKSRPRRTAAQAGIAGAIFVIINYIFRGFLDWDLDPAGEGKEIPVIVMASFTTVVTYLASLFQNRKKS